MGKILKSSSARHEPSHYTQDFIRQALSQPWAQLPRHFATFPKEWPFPRGDLNHWIDLLNRFDEILEQFVRTYELDSGPQTLPFLCKVLLHECDQNNGMDSDQFDSLAYPEDGDRILIESILDFTALLFDNCSNRSLYRSSDRLGSILNTSDTFLLHANLRLCLRLAKRFHTTRTRQQNNSNQLPQLLKDQFDVNLEHLLQIAAPFPHLQPSHSDRKSTSKSKERRTSSASHSLHPSDLVGFLKAKQQDEELQSWLSLEYTTYDSTKLATASSLRLNGNASEPSSPSIRRPQNMNTKNGDAEAGRSISITSDELKLPVSETFAKFSEDLPADDRYGLLNSLRIAKAMQHPETRQHLVSMRLLAVAILAFVHGDHTFQQKLSAPIAEEPRAFQLPHQLSELLQPAETSGVEVHTSLQTVVITCFEALCMQKSINADVYSALSANVSHGVLFYVVRKAVAQLHDQEDTNPNGTAVIDHVQEDWRNALFELLRTIPHAAPRAAENLFAAGVLDILNDVLRLRTSKALRTQHKVITFLDNFIHSVRESIGPYVSSNGLEIVAELVASTVDDAQRRLQEGHGLPEAYRSRGAEYDIPFFHQSTIKVCLKLLSHMMMHQNGNYNRHIRVLFDSRHFVASLNKVLQGPVVFGSALWSSVLNFMSEFLNNEPTSYSIVAESQLNESFLQILSNKIDLPPLIASGPRSIRDWIKHPHKTLLASSDAMMAVPTAISALCLNESGIRQFQNSDLFSNFLETFESPAHLNVMENESIDVPVALGRAFDELVRHHPSYSGGLRQPITAAIVQMAERVIIRAEHEAEQYGFGAKLYIPSVASSPADAKKPPLFVSGGREALRGRLPSIVDNSGEQDGDSSMSDSRVLPDQIVLTSEYIDQNKASPGPMVMLFNTLRFLAAFCANQATRQSFMTAGGVRLILDMITSPAIPGVYQMGDPSIVSSVSKLLQFLIEDRPWLVIPAIFERLTKALNLLEPFYRNNSGQGFFSNFTTWKPKSDRSQTTTQLSDVAHIDLGTAYVKALLNVRILTEGLAIVFQNQTYNHRSQASLFVAANYTDVYVAVIARLGELQRSCAWQELQMILDPSLPKAMLDGIRLHKGRVTSHLLFAEDILVDHGIAVPEWRSDLAIESSSTAKDTIHESAPEITNVSNEQAGIFATETETSANGIVPPQTSAENFEGHNTAQCKNIAVLRNVFQEIFLSVGTLTSALSRTLIARRGQDPYSKQNAQKVAAQIAVSTIEQLKYVTPQGNSAEKCYAYWVTILSNAYNLFVDESSTSPHALTLFINSFKVHGGFAVLEDMVDVLLQHRGKLRENDASSSFKVNYIKGCISLVLDIFGPIVVAKHVTESPQSQALVVRGAERSRSDYFNPGQFLLELRLLAMQPIMKLWPSGKGDDAEIIRGQIDILRPILEAEGESGAFSRADNIVVKTKAIPKKWAPRSSETLELLSTEFGEDLAKEALFRCCDNTANARSYCSTFHDKEDLNDFKRNPIPPSELSSDASHGSSEVQASSAPRRATPSRANTTNDDEEDDDLNVEDMETSDSDDDDDDEESDDVDIEPDLDVSSQELSEEIIPSTVEDLEDIRSEIRGSLIDRCLDLLNSHDDLPFELRDLVTAACKSKSFLTHKDVGPTVLTSVVSLQPDGELSADEAKAHWKKIAAYSLFLALILQMKEFYEAARDDLLEHLDILLDLTKYNSLLDSSIYGDATSHILLVLEFLFQEDMSPQKVTWHPPTDPNAQAYPLTVEVEKPILSADQRSSIFNAILDMMSHVGDNTKLAMAVTRALVALTRQRELAVRLGEKKNLQRLFSMIKQIGGSADANMQHNLLLILRHIIEDDDILRQIMRSEIQTVFETRGRQNFETASYCRNLSHLALRSPRLFLEVSQELVKITKYDSHHPSQFLAIKKAQANASQVNKNVNGNDVSKQAGSDTTTDAMEMSVAGLDAKTGERGKQIELRMPVNETSDGLINFMLTELINYKDVEDNEPSTLTQKSDTVEAQHESTAEIDVANDSGSASASNLSPFDLVLNDDKYKSKNHFKPEHNKIYLYRCFLLQSLTELLSSYTKAKIDFINFRRRTDAAGTTPSRPRSLVLNYLLQNLIPTGIVAHAEDNASKKREATSQWASHVINGLCAKTFEVSYVKQETADSFADFDLSSWQEEPELMYVRKYALEQSIKAFREALSSTEGIDAKYSRILKLSDLFYRLLVQKAQTSPVSVAAHEMIQLSQKMLAKIMYEKGFIAALTAAITEIDLTHPGAKRVVKYLLRPLKHLTDMANDLSMSSDGNGPAETFEHGEIESDSAESDINDVREETPDLFRNSTLGILAGGVESESDSDEVMEEDDMYDDYMDGDYDEDMAYDDDDEDMNHDPEEIVSDEDEDMTGLVDPNNEMQSFMGGMSNSSDDDEDEDDEDSEEDDSEDDGTSDEDDSDDDHDGSVDEDIELENGESANVADDDWATESPEEEDEDDEAPQIHEFGGIPPIIQQLQDLERGITHLNNLTMLEGMSDPPGYDSPSFQPDGDDAVPAVMHHDLEDGELDDDEDGILEDYEEDIVYEPEGDDEDDFDIFDMNATRMVGRPSDTNFAPFFETTTRRGHHHHHHHSDNLRQQFQQHFHPPGMQVHSRIGHGPPNGARPRQDDGTNPLLQRQMPTMASAGGHDIGDREAIFGGFESFLNPRRPFPGPADAPQQQMSFINNIMNLITSGGGTHVLPSHHGHAVRVQINSHDGSMLVRPRNFGRHGNLPPASAGRDDPLQASHFTVSTTSSRWQEEARILFGALVTEKAGYLVNALHRLLVPPALEAQKEEEARQTRLEEERKEKERKEREEQEVKEKREREESEAKAREQRVLEQAAMDAAMAEAANRETEAVTDAETLTAQNESGVTASSDDDRMSGVETTQAADNLEVDEVPTNELRAPVMRMLGGNQVDIAALGIDADFFDALPPDMQEETFMMQVVTQRAEAEVAGAEATEFDSEFLAALPAEMREEILQTSRQERRRREREAERRRLAESTPVGAAQAEEMDIPNFLASLENGDLRRSILMDADEEVLRQLPAELVAEARQYSRLHGNRPFRTEFASVGSHAHPTVGLARPEPPIKPRKPQQFVQILDKASVAVLLRLLFLQQSGSLKSSFNEILGSICQNKQNRAEVVSIILSVLQDTGNDVSMDKTLAHLLTRGRQTPAKPPQSRKDVVDVLQRTDLSPAMVAKNCLDALSQLTANQKVVEFFLTEHETNAAFKPKTPRKGKGKDTKANRFPINALLSLLDRKLITENAGLMENLAVLLQALTAPLSALAKRKQEDAEAAKAKESTAKTASGQAGSQQAGAVAEDGAAQGSSTTPALTNDAAMSAVSAEAETVEAEAQSAADGKKPRGVREAPEITDHNLRLVINIIAARECSSRAFQKTLTLVTHLSSSIPNAISIFGQELTRQAQELGRNILHDLRDLLKQIREAKSGHEVQGVAIAKFSPASSDQTKLLRVIKALGYIFDPTRTFATQASTAVNEKLLQRLYENDTFRPLWDTLSASLSAIYERGNMMNVATILLPLIEVLMVVCQNQTPQEPLTTPGIQASLKESFLSANIPELPNNISYMFLRFTDEHKKILNELVRNNPKLMSGSFSVLVKNSKVLEFDNKRNYFQRKLHTKENQNGQRPSYPSLHVNVRRESTFLDSFRSLSFKKPDEFKFGKLNVRFQGEEGVDAGGLTREWFQVLVQQIFNPNYALFNPMASDRLTYHPNPLSSINDVHLSYFQFVGRIIGKAMYESRPLDCHFSRAVYKRMLGLHVGVKDMEAHDPSYYTSLKYILENKLEDGMIGEFTFAAETEEFGEIKIEDLISNGRNIPVTDDNKREYVRLIVEHKLVTSVKDQLDSFLKGFHDIIPADIISIFTEQELELLISGLPEIDVDDWKNNTEYSGYTASSPQIVWFWRMVRSFDKEQRAKLLQFVTGTSKVPLNGFKELEGMNGFSRFSIHRDYTSDRLPSAHTCFNQLDLPEYDSYEKLRDTLLLAITDGSGEFGFA